MQININQNLKNAWRNCNSASVGFLNSIPTSKINLHVFPKRFKTFGWEFACLVRTRYCYLQGLKTGELNFSNSQEIPDKSKLLKLSKAQLAEHLVKTSKLIIKEIEKITDPTKIDFVIWLLQHERIHQGKLMLYHANLKFKLPASFVKTWGESNFK